MRYDNTANLHRRSAQSSGTSSFEDSPRAPSQNALKHGLRSAAILLPGEDAAEFQALRHDLFSTYKPGTWDEALSVEDMARHRWRMARCARRQVVYEDKLDEFPGGDRAATHHGDHCEGDPHRWMHKSMDCELLEGRLDRRLIRTRDKLLELQRLRRHNLIPGAIECATDWRELEERGDPAPETDVTAAPEDTTEAATPAPQANSVPQAGSAPQATPAPTHSRNIGFPKNSKRNPRAVQTLYNTPEKPTGSGCAGLPPEFYP